ncbi:MAG: glycosyltransferase [Sulfurimonas sp.]|nr:glycosyltransferase [Sulfurimonas sp.]
MHTNNFLVSVIIPAYNHEKYILKALDSVLNDEYPNKELVIIDDGSTDETNSLITHWIKNNTDKLSILSIKYKTRSNKGVSKTLNELIRMSDGEYICIVASDDYLLNGGIAKRVEYLQQNTTKMAVFGDCIVVNQENITTYASGLKNYYTVKIENYQDDTSLKNEIIMRWSVPGPVFMARRIMYTKHNIFYSENLIGEDWDMYLRLVSKNYLGFIDFKVAAYRIHDSNTCISFENEILIDRIKTIISNLKLFALEDKVKLIYMLAKLILVSNMKFSVGIYNKYRKK